MTEWQTVLDVIVQNSPHSTRLEEDCADPGRKRTSHGPHGDFAEHLGLAAVDASFQLREVFSFRLSNVKSTMEFATPRSPFSSGTEKLVLPGCTVALSHSAVLSAKDELLE